MLRRLGADQVHALRVGANLGGVERGADVVDELLLLLRGHGGRLGIRGLETRGGVGSLRGDALILDAGDEAGVEGGRDGGDGDGELRGLLHGPLARALHARLVQDLVHQETIPGLLVILLGEDERGDLDEERVQLRGVPLVERGGELGVGQAADRLEDVVRLGDELHVAVLDSVVNHLDEVAGAAGSDVGGARAAVGLRAHLGDDGLDDVVGRLGAAGHHGGAVPGALLAAADAHAEVEETLLLERLGAALGVLVPLVTAVDDDVAGLHVLREALDRGVHGGASLDEDDHAAGLGEGLDELAHLLEADEVFAEALLLGPGHGIVGLIARTVVHGDLETLLGDVQGQVLRIGRAGELNC